MSNFLDKGAQEEKKNTQTIEVDKKAVGTNYLSPRNEFNSCLPEKAKSPYARGSNIKCARKHVLVP